MHCYKWYFLLSPHHWPLIRYGLLAISTSLLEFQDTVSSSAEVRYTAADVIFALPYPMVLVMIVLTGSANPVIFIKSTPQTIKHKYVTRRCKESQSQTVHFIYLLSSHLPACKMLFKVILTCCQTCLLFMKIYRDLKIEIWIWLNGVIYTTIYLFSVNRFNTK